MFSQRCSRSTAIRRNSIGYRFLRLFSTCSSFPCKVSLIRMSQVKGSVQRLLRHLSIWNLLRLSGLWLCHAASCNERRRAQDGGSFDKSGAIPFKVRSHDVLLKQCCLEFSFRKRVPGVLRGSQHVLDFGLLCIERKSVGETRLRVVELQRQFVEFEPAACGTRKAP